MVQAEVGEADTWQRLVVALIDARRPPCGGAPPHCAVDLGFPRVRRGEPLHLVLEGHLVGRVDTGQGYRDLMMRCRRAEAPGRWWDLLRQLAPQDSRLILQVQIDIAISEPPK